MTPKRHPAHTAARTAPRLWQRVRRWLQRSLVGKVPRPMPILLEDLYPPPARAVYRRVRTWEQNLTTALEDDQLGGLADASRAELHERVRLTGRALRRHLLTVQRLRFVVANHPDTTESHPLYTLWAGHRIGWSGGMSAALEQLERASEPFVGWDGVTDIAQPVCDHLVRLTERVTEQAHARTAHVRSALRGHEETGRTPS